MGPELRSTFGWIKIYYLVVALSGSIDFVTAVFKEKGR